MDGPGAGLIAVALWVAALLAIALVIRSSIRRDSRPRSSRRPASQTTLPAADNGSELNEDLSYADSEEFQELGERHLVGARPKSRASQRSDAARKTRGGVQSGNRRSPRPTSARGGRSLDAQIEALAAGTDDELDRLIRTVQASRPPSGRRSQTQTSTTTSDSDDDGSLSAGEISFIVVDEEGRPELN